MIDPTIMLGVGMFTGTVLFLVAVILVARSRLVSSGDVICGRCGEQRQ